MEKNLKRKIINKISLLIEKNREEKNDKLEFLSGQFCEKDFLAPAYINNSDPKYLEIDNIYYSS